MSISLSSMKNVLGVAGLFVSLIAMLSRSPMTHRLGEFIWEIFQHAQQRVGCRLPEAADRGVAHQGRQLGQERRVPRTALHQLGGLLAADPAGRALAATFVLEEPHQV